MALTHPPQKTNFFRLGSILLYAKMWIGRTMSWINMLNSGMILFLVLSKLQEYGIKIHITFWFFPIYFLIVLLMVVFGYLEDKAGFFREELRIAQERNPQLNEILHRLGRIEAQLAVLTSSKTIKPAKKSTSKTTPGTRTRSVAKFPPSSSQPSSSHKDSNS
ncbi:MAG: hypothetical protein QW594_02440 [Candidatus Woesearchaeota archaeon]